MSADTSGPRAYVLDGETFPLSPRFLNWASQCAL
jgi:hypothetical protein